MPETGSPLEDEQQNIRSVSPLTFLPASRCSTPGISSLDGSPRYLFALPPPPPRPRSASPLGMAVKSLHHANLSQTERRTKVKPITNHAIEGQEPSTEPSDSGRPSEDPIPNHGPTTIPPLNALSDLCRLEQYQTRKCKQVQHQLHQAQVTAARASRLIYTARSVQRTLAECIKSEDKHSFVNLSNALHDAFDCVEAADTSGQPSGAESAQHVSYPNSCLDVLAADSRAVVLEFISMVRHDGNFVADRLAALTHRELVSLLPDKGQPRSTDSIFGSSPRTSSRTSRHLGFVADAQTELLSSFEYGSPLETLVLAPRGVSQPPLANDPIATETWSTACARLISEQKPGCERFVPAVINMWAMSSPWPGKERLGMWISQTLQDGAFLLDQPNKQTFKVRAQGLVETNATHEARIEQFFTNSVNSLFNLLGTQFGASVIPDGATRFCNAIYQNLSTSHQQAFPNFALTRWLISTFLMDAITLPEIHGLMTDHYFPEHMRRQVLREIAGRTQKAVFDFVYSWKHGTAVSNELSGLLRTVASCFHPSTQDQAASNNADRHEPLDCLAFIPMSLADMTAIVSALCPRRRLDSVSSDFEPPYGGLKSSASSISGLSLFQSSGSSEAIYKIPQPWSPEPQQPIMETFEPNVLGDETSNDRVDPVLHPDFDSDQLWEACTSMEDFVANQSSTEPGAWCILVDRAGGKPLRTLRAALLNESDGATLDTEIPGVASSKVTRLLKNRDVVRELLSNGDLMLSSDAIVDSSTGLDHLSNAFGAAFDKRLSDAERDSDFVMAHSWFRKRKNFNAQVAEDNGRRELFLMLNEIKLDLERSMDWSSAIMASCAEWLRSLGSSLEVYGKNLLHRSETIGRLRDKMWYVAEIRPSAAYEEVRLIVSALQTMGKPKSAPRTRLAPPLRHWSGPKAPTGGSYARTEAQTLEILSTLPDYGGPNKLSDDQSRALYSWMERNTVENLCAGEERIHKLCMEIRKAVDQITLEGSPLLASSLFAREKGAVYPQRKSISSSPLWPLQPGSGRFDLLTLQTNLAPSIDSVSSASSHPLSARSSRDHLDQRSPAMTSRSSAPFWSPVVTEAQSPSSATSVGSSQTHAAGSYRGRQSGFSVKSPNQNLLEQLRQRSLSLLLSEFTAITYSDGSETDRAFWTELGGDLTIKHLSSQRLSFLRETSPLDERFNFEQAFQTQMRRFQSTSNPFTKLKYLLEADSLLAPFMASQDEVDMSRTESKLNTLTLQKLKRQGSSQASLKIEGFRRLLCDPSIRPNSIFRDLQYIAALVPSTMLETTPQGKAFWNVAVAASSLKQEVRQLMVETADGIISYHSNNRGHGRAASTAQQERDSATFSVPSRTPSAEDIKRYTMADAAYLLQITAKEGDPAAQRELATLYLTHPELMDHIIAPFSRSRDVFKEELESKWRKNQDPNRCDPMTMCVAHHWMTLSSKGGDALAKEYLRQREEMDRLG